MISSFIKSFSVFWKNCKQLENEDYDELAKFIKLNKVEKNTRLFNYGDPANDLIVILRGQLGIIYPNATLIEIMKDGQDMQSRIELLTQDEAETKKRDNIFITGQDGNVHEHQFMAEKQRKLYER